jgi:Na+/H+ antiporter NhaD/arsenite permease-like protein
VLAVVIILFFIHPFVHAINLSLPWIALTGAMALLVRPPPTKNTL